MRIPNLRRTTQNLKRRRIQTRMTSSPNWKMKRRIQKKRS